MDPSSIAAIVISLIAALGTWAGHRASAKASEKNTAASNGVEMEKGAYERARKLDVDTIERQGREIGELRELVISVQTDNRALRADNESLHAEIRSLKQQLESQRNA